jgi:hypothetical protein
MRTSNALDLERRVFTKRSPRAIAQSLKRSAERSKRRKSAPFRSAMSMLNFHINRGGKGLSKSQRVVLERAKRELRKLYGREPAGSARRSHARKTHGRARAKKRRAQVKHPPPRRASSSARRSITSAKASTASDRRSSYRHRTIEGQARRREARPAAEREEDFSQKDPAFGAPRARCRQGAAARTRQA